MVVVQRSPADPIVPAPVVIVPAVLTLAVVIVQRCLAVLIDPALVAAAPADLTLGVVIVQRSLAVLIVPALAVIALGDLISAGVIVRSCRADPIDRIARRSRADLIGPTVLADPILAAAIDQRSPVVPTDQVVRDGTTGPADPIVPSSAAIVRVHRGGISPDVRQLGTGRLAPAIGAGVGDPAGTTGTITGGGKSSTIAIAAGITAVGTATGAFTGTRPLSGVLPAGA